jgi:hypothetical protein
MSHSTVHIGYKGKYIEGTVNIKFFGLQIYNYINWKNHTEQMIPKVSGTCYAIRLMVHVSNISTLKTIYYACFHSIIKYKIQNIFWGDNSSNSWKISTLQKKIIITMAGARPRTSGRSIFKQLEILPVPCQYKLLVMALPSIIRKLLK